MFDFHITSKRQRKSATSTAKKVTTEPEQLEPAAAVQEQQPEPPELTNEEGNCFLFSTCIDLKIVFFQQITRA